MLETNQNSLKEKDSEGFIVTFITTFTTVFVAELGDKTQVATLLLSAQSGTPIIVFIGASFALVMSSLLGVLVGSYLSSKVQPSLFKRIASVIMIGIGLISLIELVDANHISLSNVLRF